jgi:formyl-CoA transferase
MSKALDGVRILDFTHVQSGPTCTQLLAWFGADVIKVERAGEATSRAASCATSRRRQPLLHDAEPQQALDHRRREASERQGGAREPRQACDVLVENFAPGALDRMGFTWERIQQLNPRMIVASVKGFGPGPYEDCKVYENVAQCAGARLDDRLRRRPAARHRRADRRQRHGPALSRSASSRRCISATRPAAASACSRACRTAC